jgi:preprotein translocase subunit SecF
LVSTLIITLLLPLTLIILSYLKIIDGISLGMVMTAIAVILSSIYIFYGTILMAVQDKKDKDEGHL